VQECVSPQECRDVSSPRGLCPGRDQGGGGGRGLHARARRQISTSGRIRDEIIVHRGHHSPHLYPRATPSLRLRQMLRTLPETLPSGPFGRQESQARCLEPSGIF